MKKVDHQNAMKRAEYEDQLRQQAKDRNMQRELEMQRKQEELKRRKFFLSNPIYRRKWVFVLFRQWLNDSSEIKAFTKDSIVIE